MEDKKVAILLSTYNGEKYVIDQIHSIMTQTYKNIILIIRDDGSTDKTVRLVKEYMQGHDNIKLIEGRNLGFIKSFFELLKAEQADYYAYCDQDDVWLPEKISTAVNSLNILDNDYPNMEFSNSDYYDAEMKLIAPGEKGKKYSFLNSLYECCSQGMTMVINQKTKDYILDYVPEKVFFHDWWTYMICAGMGQIVYDDVTTVKYRRTGKNETAEGEGFIKVLIWRITHLFGKGGLKSIRIQQNDFKKFFYDKTIDSNKKILDTFVRDRYSIGGAFKKAFYSGQIRRSKLADLAIRVMFIFGLL